MVQKQLALLSLYLYLQAGGGSERKGTMGMLLFGCVCVCQARAGGSKRLEAKHQ